MEFGDRVCRLKAEPGPSQKWVLAVNSLSYTYFLAYHSAVQK